MISRQLAADVRYEHLVNGVSVRALSETHGQPCGVLHLVIQNKITPPPEPRVVVSPSYTPKRGKLTPEQRTEIAYYVCFGMPLRGLAVRYGVNLRSISRIKDQYTAAVEGEATLRKTLVDANAALDPNIVAEVRYRHIIEEEDIAAMAAHYLVAFKNLWRAAKGLTYRPGHGRALTEAGLNLDPKSTRGHMLLLYFYGADTTFIANYLDQSRELVDEVVLRYTRQVVMS